jgi:hypothetical protein
MLEEKCPAYLAINFAAIGHEMLEKHFQNGCLLSPRGNIQESFGITNLNQQVESSVEVSRPQIVVGTKQCHVEVMILMTQLMQEVSKLKGKCMKVPSQHNAKFAGRLCTLNGLPNETMEGEPNNVGEAITFAIPILCHADNEKVKLFGQPLPGNAGILLSHLDVGNCPEIPHEIIAYRILKSKYGVWLKISAILYWKKAVSDYYRRVDGARRMKDNFWSYFAHICPTRLMPSIQHCHTNPLYQNEDPLVPRLTLPHIDKATGFHSAAAHCLTELVLVRKPQWFPSLESVCEVVLPFAFICSYANIYKMYHEWARRTLRPNFTKTGNLFLEAFNHLLRKHKGINRAPGP